MFRKCLVSLAFLWATAVSADTPSLTVPTQVSGSVGAFLTVPATTSGKTVKWIVLDPGLTLFPSSLLKDTRTAVVSSPKPGTFRLLAITALGDELSEPVCCSVVIQSDSPTPAPAPQPGPAPSPAPQHPEKAAWAVALIDNTHRTPALGQLLGSATLISTLRQSGVTLRVLDVTDPLVHENGYSDAVAVAGGTPTLLVLSAKGKRLRASKLPGDEASILAAIGIAAAASQCGPNGCPFQPRNAVFFPEVQR